MNSKLTGEGGEGAAVQKKTIAIFGNKQRLMSIDMKTKVVQHVPRINLIFTIPLRPADVVKKFLNVRQKLGTRNVLKNLKT